MEDKQFEALMAELKKVTSNQVILDEKLEILLKDARLIKTKSEASIDNDFATAADLKKISEKLNEIEEVVTRMFMKRSGG